MIRNTSRPAKRGRESSSTRSLDNFPEVGLAAIASYKTEKGIGDFIAFMLETLERNCDWLNSVVNKQANFKCALMTGAGPNRFQLQETIYPSNNENMRLSVEMNNSEDHDKVSLVALLKMNNADMDNLLAYMKSRMSDNPTLKEDLLRGQAMGLSFAVLTPFSERQYRVSKRIVIGSSSPEPCKRRRRDY